MGRNEKDKKTGKETDESLVDVLRVEGVNAKGYGTVPKAVMKDRRLSIQAKGLYAYFCSYSGSGNKAFPGRDIIIRDLGISKDSYYKYLEALKECDYIRVTQERTAGRYRRNIFILVTNPKKPNLEPFSPCPKFSDTVEPPCPDLSDTINQDTNINKYKKNDSLSINPKINTDWMDRMDEYSLFVKENIEYDLLLSDEQNKALSESIYLLIMDVLCGDEKTFKVNGAVMDAQVIRKRFLELRYLDVASVIDGIGKLAERVHNMRNYLLTALFNARATSEAHWKADINATIRAYRENPTRKR